jgi:hypothetical protein
MVFAGWGCAHADSRQPVPSKCTEKQAALRIARDFARQTEQADGVTVLLREERTIEEPDAWKLWTEVSKRGVAADDAYLLVRKANCAADWAQVLYEK